MLNVNPPTVPLVALRTPAGVTLKGAEANVACPNCIPSSASAIKIVFPLPKDKDLFVVFNTKFVAVKLSLLIVNPPITPPVAVIVPDISTLPAASK